MGNLYFVGKGSLWGGLVYLDSVICKNGKDQVNKFGLSVMAGCEV